MPLAFETLPAIFIPSTDTHPSKIIWDIVEMDIRGMVKFSLVDYPGKLACVLFTGSCNMRCPFCHNPHLVLDPGSQPLIREAQVFHFLKTRVGKLDGVVISGGEPTLQKSLPAFAAKAVEMGFLIKIDSNGSAPDVLKALHSKGLLHALGIDYKAPASKYVAVSRCKDEAVAGKVAETLRFAVEKGIPLDVRTTVHRALLSPEDLATMRAELDSFGVENWALQLFNPVEVMDEGFESIPSYGERELLDVAKGFRSTKVRGLTGVYLEP